MITIDLVIRGKSKRFTASGVCLRARLDAYDLYRDYTEAGGDFSNELLQRCMDFTRRVFGNAFSEEQLLDGYQGSAFRLFPNLLNAVVSYSNEQIANFPEPAMAPEIGVETTT